MDKTRNVNGGYVTTAPSADSGKCKFSFMTTGAAVARIAVFVPMAAPVGLRMNVEDIEVETGYVFEVMSDTN